MESLLAILAPETEGATVLDLFAGTGQVGLSLQDRGAQSVVFVEAERRVAQDLKQRLRGIPGTRLVVGQVPKILSRVEGPFSLILADPPYDWSGAEELFLSLEPLAEADSLFVVEHHHKVVYQAPSQWELERQKKFGETRLSFFRFRGA